MRDLAEGLALEQATCFNSIEKVLDAFLQSHSFNILISFLFLLLFFLLLLLYLILILNIFLFKIPILLLFNSR